MKTWDLYDAGLRLNGMVVLLFDQDNPLLLWFHYQNPSGGGCFKKEIKNT